MQDVTTVELVTELNSRMESMHGSEFVSTDMMRALVGNLEVEIINRWMTHLPYPILEMGMCDPT